MFEGPFKPLAIFLLVTVVTVILLPLVVFVGYPWLIIIAGWYVCRGVQGRVERPGQVAAVWAVYLGLILLLHGIMIGFDTALAGAPPSDAQKLFGRRLAYLGGAIAGISVLVAYAIDLRRRVVWAKPSNPKSLDELAQ